MPFLYAFNEAVTFSKSYIGQCSIESLSAIVNTWLLEAKQRLFDGVNAFPTLLNSATKLLEPIPQMTSVLAPPKDNAWFAMESYFKHKKLSGEWTGRTANESVTPFQLFIEIAGDKNIDAFTRSDARHYRDTLLQMPSSRKKRPQYRTKSIPELLNMTIPDEHLLRKKTVNSHLILISSCFKWFVSEGKLSSNVFEGLQVKESDSVTYKPFTMSELKRLFDLEVYTDAGYKFNKSYKFWTPLLGLYTGARLNELCQLRLSDIGQDSSGIWFIDINDEDDRTTKNNSSNRRTPIHSSLITLGFIEYVGLLKASGHIMLFPDLKKGAQSWKDNASKAFSMMAKKAGIKQDRTKCFHSFRKNAVDAIAINAPKDSVVSAIVGHKQMGMTFSRYFSEYPLEELQQAIDLIDYGLDLEALRGKWRRFVT